MRKPTSKQVVVFHSLGVVCVLVLALGCKERQEGDDVARRHGSWMTATGALLFQPIPWIRHDHVSCLAASLDGTRLVVGHGKGLDLYDVQKEERIQSIPSAWVRLATVSSANRRMLYVEDYPAHRAMLWDERTGKVTPVLSTFRERITFLDFPNGGTNIALGAESISVCNLVTSQEITRFDLDHNERAWTLIDCGSTQLVLTVALDPERALTTLRLRDMNSGVVVRHLPGPRANAVRCVSNTNKHGEIVLVTQFCFLSLGGLGPPTSETHLRVQNYLSGEIRLDAVFKGDAVVASLDGGADLFVAADHAGAGCYSLRVQGGRQSPGSNPRITDKR